MSRAPPYFHGNVESRVLDSFFLQFCLALPFTRVSREPLRVWMWTLVTSRVSGVGNYDYIEPQYLGLLPLESYLVMYVNLHLMPYVLYDVCCAQKYKRPWPMT